MSRQRTRFHGRLRSSPLCVAGCMLAIRMVVQMKVARDRKSDSRECNLIRRSKAIGLRRPNRLHHRNGRILRDLIGQVRSCRCQLTASAAEQSPRPRQSDSPCDPNPKEEGEEDGRCGCERLFRWRRWVYRPEMTTSDRNGERGDRHAHQMGERQTNSRGQHPSRSLPHLHLASATSIPTGCCCFRP